MTDTNASTKFTRVAKTTTAISLLITVVCVAVASRYYFWMIRDGFIDGRAKKVMEDAIEFSYFGILYLGPPALIGILASFWSGRARRFCIPASLLYPVLLAIYLALAELYF